MCQLQKKPDANKMIFVETPQKTMKGRKTK